MERFLDKKPFRFFDSVPLNLVLDRFPVCTDRAKLMAATWLHFPLLQMVLKHNNANYQMAEWIGLSSLLCLLFISVTSNQVESNVFSCCHLEELLAFTLTQAQPYCSINLQQLCLDFWIHFKSRNISGLHLLFGKDKGTLSKLRPYWCNNDIMWQDMDRKSSLPFDKYGFDVQFLTKWLPDVVQSVLSQLTPSSYPVFQAFLLTRSGIEQHDKELSNKLSNDQMLQVLKLIKTPLDCAHLETFLRHSLLPRCDNDLELLLMFVMEWPCILIYLNDMEMVKFVGFVFAIKSDYQRERLNTLISLLKSHQIKTTHAITVHIVFQLHHPALMIAFHKTLFDIRFVVSFKKKSIWPRHICEILCIPRLQTMMKDEQLMFHDPKPWSDPESCLSYMTQEDLREIEALCQFRERKRKRSTATPKSTVIAELHTFVTLFKLYASN